MRQDQPGGAFAILCRQLMVDQGGRAIAGHVGAMLLLFGAAMEVAHLVVGHRVAPCR
ncbi:hypothetical protein AB5I41_15800 [Sphingomonas sp. MMS24-JH45]